MINTRILRSPLHLPRGQEAFLFFQIAWKAFLEEVVPLAGRDLNLVIPATIHTSKMVCIFRQLENNSR